MNLRTLGKLARGDGFNLVVLAMAITVLNILLALALPVWSTYIRREREEELIFRGLQYAEAIRVFQLRHSRLPTQLRELVEVQPRSIRQLWRNPMVEDGAWLLLPAGQLLEQQPNEEQGGGDGEADGEQPNGEGPNNGRQRPRGGTAPAAVRVVPPRPGELQFTPQPSVPFMGVASPEGGESVKTFLGSSELAEWRFTVELVNALQHDPNHNFARPVNSGLFWKPFPPGVTLPQQGGVNPLGGNPQGAGNPPGGRPQPQQRPRPQ
jgi:type II secretory pathway pseudopilin PulG